MKITYSLSEFLEQVRQVAESIRVDYYTASAEVSSRGTIEFRAYIHGFKFAIGKTVEECIRKLRETVFPVNTEVDVQFEQEA